VFAGCSQEAPSICGRREVPAHHFTYFTGRSSSERDQSLLLPHGSQTCVLLLRHAGYQPGKARERERERETAHGAIGNWDTRSPKMAPGWSAYATIQPREISAQLLRVRGNPLQLRQRRGMLGSAQPLRVPSPRTALRFWVRSNPFDFAIASALYTPPQCVQSHGLSTGWLQSAIPRVYKFELPRLRGEKVGLCLDRVRAVIEGPRLLTSPV
jgi:hypothetical protein